VFFVWPLAVPACCLWSRGRGGWGTLGGLLAALVAPWVLGTLLWSRSHTPEAIMGRFAFFFSAAILVGCGKSEVPPTRDTTAVAPAPPETQPGISLADIAGKWKLRTMDGAGGNVVESELTATADTSGWTLTRPNRKVVPVRVVAVGGDSIITEAGPYESALRKGVQVRSRMVLRLQHGKLVGTNEARYALSGGDSVAQRPAEATRVP
jgi:hypothetical protein